MEAHSTRCAARAASPHRLAATSVHIAFHGVLSAKLAARNACLGAGGARERRQRGGCRRHRSWHGHQHGQRCQRLQAEQRRGDAGDAIARAGAWRFRHRGGLGGGRSGGAAALRARQPGVARAPSHSRHHLVGRDGSAHAPERRAARRAGDGRSARPAQCRRLPAAAGHGAERHPGARRPGAQQRPAVDLHLAHRLRGPGRRRAAVRAP